MGPRFRKRGNGSPISRSAFLTFSFNGAALSEARKPASEATVWFPITALQWGRAFGSAETGPDSCRPIARRQCFNGAALSEARKPPVALTNAIIAFSLQWGRAFGSAETARSQNSLESPTCSFNGAALSEARKHVAATFDDSVHRYCFNGAALSEARKRQS